MRPEALRTQIAFSIGAIVGHRRPAIENSMCTHCCNRRQSAPLDMTWQQFESLVGEHFRQQGFEVRLTGQNVSDGGVDIELRWGIEFCLV